jgi:iron complex outermembrane recepter protein
VTRKDTNYLGAASGLALAVALSAIATAAHAQSTNDGKKTAEETKKAATVGEVVVTASRTAENIQTVPAAVSALSGPQLEKKSVFQVSDLQYATPALSITDAALTQNVNIRGIGLSSGNPAVVPGVPIYLDWLLQPPIVTTNSFFDIGDVEVYRGPQGTFAGASSTGGAVFITSNSPTFSGVGGNVEVWGGNYTDVGSRGAVNLPVNDKLAFRVAYNIERRDSFFHDIGGQTTPTGGSFETPGKLNEQDLRLSALWEPVDNLSILFKVGLSQKDTGGYDYRPIPGTFYAQFAPIDLRTLNFDQPEKNDEKSNRNSLEIKYELPDGITLRSVTGFQYNKVVDLYDSDASNGPPAQYEAQDVSERPITQEFNILSPSGGRLSWILGGFYWHDSIKVGLDLDTAGQPHTYVSIFTEKYSEAVFGRAQYQLTNALQLEVGGRYTHDVVNNGGQIQIVIPGLPPLVTIPNSGQYAGDNWTGKVALNYTLNQDNFLYAFASKGAKAGGSNGNTSFLPETVWAYEVGWKTQLFERKLRLQLDGFYNDYRNYQVDGIIDLTTGTSGTGNTKGATIKGVEAQGQGRIGGLALDFGLAWVDSNIGPVTLINNRLLPGGGATNLGAQCATGVPSNPPICFDYTPYFVSVEGRSNTYAPRWTYNFGVEYNIDVGSGATLTPRIDYSYQGSQWTTLLENATDFLPSHGIWNAHLTYARGSYAIIGYVTNLANKTYVSGQFINDEFLGPPRQFGVRASYRF